MGKVGLAVIVAVLALAATRLYSQYALQQRVSDYREGLRRRALEAVSGIDSVPSEALIRERAEALAAELDLHVSDIQATITRDATPTGVGGMVAAKLGALPGMADADARGEVSVGPDRSLRTTLLEVSAQVHGEGFLCSIDERLSASSNIGYAIE